MKDQQTMGRLTRLKKSRPEQFERLQEMLVLMVRLANARRDGGGAIRIANKFS